MAPALRSGPALQAYPMLVGEACEVVVGPDGRQRYCREPSMFRYVGNVPPDMRPSEIKRRGLPCIILMCPDHAMRMAHDVSWHVKDGKCWLVRLDMVIFRMHCSTCGAFTKLAWDTDAPSLNPGHFGFCPRCGANTNATLDPEADYWDLMSAAFNNMPIQLLQLLYHEWNRVKYSRFRDYVEAAIASDEAMTEDA